MSSKVANLIALELGVLIAILAWLAFSNLQSAKSQSIARQPMRTVDSFATVAPGLKSTNSRRPAVDYRAADLPAEEAQTAVQTYEEPTVSQPYPSSSLDGYIAETAPYYDAIEPEPVLTSPDCYADPYFAYSQPSTIIVLSNSRFPNRRFRSAQRPGGARMVAHRPPAMVTRHSSPRVAQPHLRGSGARPRQNAPVQSSRPRPRLGPRHNP